eukprot:scaffold10170_cov277-Chaetoceros_neogracile.AAC.13
MTARSMIADNCRDGGNRDVTETSLGWTAWSHADDCETVLLWKVLTLDGSVLEVHDSDPSRRRDYRMIVEILLELVDAERVVFRALGREDVDDSKRNRTIRLLGRYGVGTVGGGGDGVIGELWRVRNDFLTQSLSSEH